MTGFLDEFVIFCPVCCSPIAPKAWGTAQYNCTDCGTQFAVTLKEEHVREHGHS